MRLQLAVQMDRTQFLTPSPLLVADLEEMALLQPDKMAGRAAGEDEHLSKPQAQETHQPNHHLKATMEGQGTEHLVAAAAEGPER